MTGIDYPVCAPVIPGPGPWERRTSAGHAQVSVSRDSGIRAPHPKLLGLDLMRALNPRPDSARRAPLAAEALANNLC